MNGVKHGLPRSPSTPWKSKSQQTSTGDGVFHVAEASFAASTWRKAVLFRANSPGARFTYTPVHVLITLGSVNALLFAAW